MDIHDDSFQMSHGLTIYWEGIKEIKGLNNTLMISFADGKRVDIFEVTRTEMDAIFQAYTRNLSSHHKKPSPTSRSKRKTPRSGKTPL